MKISEALFNDLKAAIDNVGGLTTSASARNRWDQLWHSKFDTNRLYDAGLNDEHIDTALRRIAHD